ESSAPSPATFDYTETSLNRVPFQVADGLGIDRFIGVVHDAGGPWFLCPATEPSNLARLDGLIVLDSGINFAQIPVEPKPNIQLLGRLMGQLSVPPEVIDGFLTFILQGATEQDVLAKFPGVVREITSTNSEEAHRLAISKIIEELVLDPLAFGGVCADSFGVLDIVEPLLIWAPPDLLSGLVVFSTAWPSARTVLVSEARHLLMLDQQGIVASSIADYLSTR
ncbi:MAG: hypothetical protein ACE5JX_16065, partial [Acidobacteriota bacterium]